MMTILSIGLVAVPTAVAAFIHACEGSQHSEFSDYACTSAVWESYSFITCSHTPIPY